MRSVNHGSRVVAIVLAVTAATGTVTSTIILMDAGPCTIAYTVLAAFGDGGRLSTGSGLSDGFRPTAPAQRFTTVTLRRGPCAT